MPTTLLDPSVQRTHADRFASLHGSAPLLLPNAWDVASALALQRAGAPAVATTSAAHAWSLGLQDGGDLTLPDVTALIARLTAVLDVPVSADIESGYAADPDGVAATTRAVLEVGAVGVNLEDSYAAGLRPVDEQARRINAVREAADTFGVPLFVNARTDTYFGDHLPEEQRRDQTRARVTAYVDAGADGVFVPGLLDLESLSSLTAELDVPVNVMAGPGAPDVTSLVAAGVRRISFGPFLANVANDAVESAARGLLTAGAYPW